MFMSGPGSGAVEHSWKRQQNNLQDNWLQACEVQPCAESIWLVPTVFQQLVMEILVSVSVL
jgi:hypothetical protein